MGAAAHADLRDTSGHQQQQRLWRSSSDAPDANLAEEGFHDGFHQRGSGGGGGGGGDVRHDALGGAMFGGGSSSVGGGRKPVRRPSHGTLLRRVQHTNGHKHGQVSSQSASHAGALHVYHKQLLLHVATTSNRVNYPLYICMQRGQRRCRVQSVLYRVAAEQPGHPVGCAQGDGVLAESQSPPCSVRAQGDSVLTEFWNLVLLTTLYAMQGVPLGLTMGSM